MWWTWGREAEEGIGRHIQGRSTCPSSVRPEQETAECDLAGSVRTGVPMCPCAVPSESHPTSVCPAWESHAFCKKQLLSWPLCSIQCRPLEMPSDLTGSLLVQTLFPPADPFVELVPSGMWSSCPVWHTGSKPMSCLLWGRHQLPSLCWGGGTLQVIYGSLLALPPGGHSGTWSLLSERCSPFCFLLLHLGLEGFHTELSLQPLLSYCAGWAQICNLPASASGAQLPAVLFSKDGCA